MCVLVEIKQYFEFWMGMGKLVQSICFPIPLYYQLKALPFMCIRQRSTDPSIGGRSLADEVRRKPANPF
jgi:hypothetical protein